MPDDANWFGVAREIVEPKRLAFADRDSLFAAEMAKIDAEFKRATGGVELTREDWRRWAVESPPTEYDAADWQTVQRMSRDARRQARRDEP